jgi:hypothetical protein
MSVQPLIIKQGISSCPADLVGLRRSVALKASESQAGTYDKNSEDDEMVGKTTRQGLLYTE